MENLPEKNNDSLLNTLITRYGPIIGIIVFVLVLCILALLSIPIFIQMSESVRENPRSETEANYDRLDSHQNNTPSSGLSETIVTNESNPSAPALTLEVARSEKEKSIGLMHRESLGVNSGMIFVYEQPQEVSFWMKNTYIPLDMIFVDENNQITQIIENTTPLDTSKRYLSESEVKYVIEVNAGWADQNNYSVGDSLEIGI